MFHSFFNSLARSKYLSFFSLSFSFILWSAVAKIRWSVCISKCHRRLCVLFSMTGTGLCIYHLLVWSNLDFLHISQWITLPTQSCLVLHYFCANLLQSLIMWLIVSSLSPHSLHLLFYCVLSILASIQLVLMTLKILMILNISVILRTLVYQRISSNNCWTALRKQYIKRARESLILSYLQHDLK